MHTKKLNVPRAIIRIVPRIRYYMSHLGRETTKADNNHVNVFTAYVQADPMGTLVRAVGKK